ncbi:MAG: HlyD family secretion protein [Jhaorihella sp.]
MHAGLSGLVLSLAIGLPAGLLERCSPGDAVALGVLARERVALTATVSEIVTELPVAQGSPVRRGQVLVQLDDRIRRADLQLAEAELASATANLEKLQAGPRKEEVAIARARVAGAQAALREAQSTYERNRVLVENNTRTPASLDRDLARRDSADAELQSAKEYLGELESGARPEDIRMAQASVASAMAHLDVARHRLGDLQITASRDGILDSLPWNLGERVAAGSPVAVLLTGEVPFARVYVPEPYRVRIAVGDRLTVHVDGLEDAFSGTVRWISSEPAFTPYYALNQEDRSRLMYLAEIDLPEGAADLAVGIPVQVDMP